MSIPPCDESPAPPSAASSTSDILGLRETKGEEQWAVSTLAI